MPEKITAEQISTMTIRSLTFQRADYYDEAKGWKAVAQMRDSSSSGLTDMTLSLDASIANVIMQMLAPVMAQKAAIAAQMLADDSIKLANALSNKLLSACDEKVD